MLNVFIIRYVNGTSSKTKCRPWMLRTTATRGIKGVLSRVSFKNKALTNLSFS